MDTKKLKLEDLNYYKGRTINEDEFIFEEHQKVELLLFLVVYLKIPGKIEDYYLVLGGRGLIPRHSFNMGDYLIQNARILLKTLNQKKVYLDELKAYETRSEKDKNLYLREDDKFVKAKNVSREVEEREQLYLKLLSLEILHTALSGKFAFQDEKRYGIILDDQPLEIKLPQLVRPTAMPKSKSKKGGKIKVLIKDLIEEAEFIDEILSGKDNAFRKRVIENNAFKRVDHGQLLEAEEIELTNITNIVGQVGAGKSTFSDVVIKIITEDKRKVVLIESSVMKILKRSEDLTKLGINVAPVIGASSWREHINRASDGKDFLRDYDSGILTTGCPLGGLIDQPGLTIEYGKEPCTAIYKFFEQDEKKKNLLNTKVNYKCPYYYSCPRTKIQSEIPNADVIVTTTAGLASMSVGVSNITLFQYVKDFVDLIVVDEAESELQKADKLYAPSIAFDNYIRSNGSIAADYYKKPSNERISSNANIQRAFSKLHQESDRAFTKIHSLLEKDIQGFSKSRLKQPFTGKRLIFDCREDGKLPLDICDELEKMSEPWSTKIQRKILEDLIDVNGENDLIDSFDSFGWGGQRDELSKDQINKIIFIGAVFNFERLYRELSNLVSGYVELPQSTKAILSQRFQFQQKYIPLSPTGNILALQYREKNSHTKPDLLVIKQFAMGRAMFLRFPWLKLDPQGKPKGPSVLLLSGSSFAPGSFSGHISEPVNYIIEAEPFKRDFISKSHFKFLDTDVFVSGSGNQRDKRLRELVAECKELIIEKLEQGDSILMVVNSYSDTEVVKKALTCMLKDTEYRDKIAQMVTDSDNEDETEGELGGGPKKIKQSKVSDFYFRGARILIAVAVLIERGHNIVDDKGNAVFDDLIFLTRPMESPDDYATHISKVNGYIMSKYSNTNFGIDTEVFTGIRKDALILYSSLNSHKYKIADLKPIVQKDIVVTLFVMILQIFGRLCRIGNQEDIKSKAPSVYFADAAFKAKNMNGFDVLNELVDYLDELMQASSVDGEIAKTLYKPLYNALKKGRRIYAKCE